MGSSSLFVIEAKLFEFVIEGCSVLRIWGASLHFFLGKATVALLLAIMEALPRAEGSKDYVKSSRVGNRAFIDDKSTLNNLAK